MVSHTAHSCVAAQQHADDVGIYAWGCHQLEILLARLQSLMLLFASTLFHALHFYNIMIPLCVCMYIIILACTVYLYVVYVWLSSIHVAILAIILHLQLFRCCLIHRTAPSLKGMQSTSPWKQALVIMSLSSLSCFSTWMGQLLVSLVHDLHIVSFHWCLNFSSIVDTVMVIGHPHLLFSAFHLTNIQ